jgi:hypothetical protein
MKDGGSGIRGKFMEGSLIKMDLFMRVSSKIICRTVKEQ